MEWLWTWGGKCFGYRDGESLWTHDGKNIGRFYNDEIYDKNGNYLGEVMDERLISMKSKKNHTRIAFNPYANRAGMVKYTDYVGYVMYVGYEDFPAPDTF